MSFEIEDVDDDEEEESYNFQSKWSQPSKSFFGGQDSELNEEDEYNFDFGKPKAKKVKSPPQWKAEPVSGNNNGNLYKKKDNNEASIAAPGSALNKAEDMLKRYGGGSSAPPIRTSAQSKAFSLHFDEDDLSLDSQSEGELDKSLNLSQSDRRNEMPFSPQAEAFENEVLSLI